MKDLENIVKEFEKIKNDDVLSKDEKSIKYGKLMTNLETEYNISIANKEEFESLPNDIKELYLAIANERNI